LKQFSSSEEKTFDFKEFSFEITVGAPGVFKQFVPGTFEVRMARKVAFLKHAIDAALFF
jgi:hypothetical protein